MKRAVDWPLEIARIYLGTYCVQKYQFCFVLNRNLAYIVWSIKCKQLRLHINRLLATLLGLDDSVNSQNIRLMILSHTRKTCCLVLIICFVWIGLRGFSDMDIFIFEMNCMWYSVVWNQISVLPRMLPALLILFAVL